MPFFEREHAGRIDIATIFGLSGASVAPVSAAPLEAWQRFAVAKGWVAGYIQLSAIDEPPPVAGLGAGNEVLLLDLGLDRAFESASLQRKIRRAEASGVELVDDGAVLAARLVQLYPEAMRRVGAGAGVQFTATSLERWCEGPSSVVLGARVGDVIEAVAMFFVAGEEAEWHLIGSTERGRELGAWLVWSAGRRLREMGVTRLNLGGGVRPGDAIYTFKKKFGAVPRPLLAARQIYDRAAYDELCAQNGTGDGSSGWFPAYRNRGA